MEVSKLGPFAKLPFKKTMFSWIFKLFSFLGFAQFSYALLFLLFLTLQYIVTKID